MFKTAPPLDKTLFIYHSCTRDNHLKTTLCLNKKPLRYDWHDLQRIWYKEVRRQRKWLHLPPVLSTLLTALSVNNYLKKKSYWLFGKAKANYWNAARRCFATRGGANVAANTARRRAQQKAKVRLQHAAASKRSRLLLKYYKFNARAARSSLSGKNSSSFVISRCLAGCAQSMRKKDKKRMMNSRWPTKWCKLIVCPARPLCM